MRASRSLAPALLAALLLCGACTSSAGVPGPVASSPEPVATSAAPTGSAPLPGPIDANWPAYHGDAARTGVSASMPPVSGPLRVVSSLKLDGAVYASPVAVGETIVAATENDTVYAVDRTGHQLWSTHLGSPSPATERPCGNIDPLGITGTPVIVGGTVYVAPEFGAPVRHQLVALSLSSGAVRWRRSLDLPGVETVAMQERGALTVSAGRVWVPFGGLAGDCGGYKGRLVGYRLDGTGSPVSYTVPTQREAGIWTPPGPSVDAAGTLFVAVGNGAAGAGGRYDHSDSVLAISPRAKLRGSFSPRTWASDNAQDLDLGSQGPALVGKWVFSAGKSGIAYVLRAAKLGGIGGQVSQSKLCASYGGTAVLGSLVYVPCTDGVRAARIDAHGKLQVLWRAASGTNGSPVVGGGRVWSLDVGAGVLHALDPATGASRQQIDVGATSRFATPALAGSEVLVPTMAGLVIIDS